MAAVPFCRRVLGGREWFTLTLASPIEGEGICGKDWWDARPFVPGFRVPAPVSGYGGGPRGNDVGGLSEPQITQIFADGL